MHQESCTTRKQLKPLVHLGALREKCCIYNMSFVGALDTWAPRIVKGTLKNLNMLFVVEKDKVEGLQERFERTEGRK